VDIRHLDNIFQYGGKNKGPSHNIPKKTFFDARNEKKKHIVTLCRCMLGDIAKLFETNNNVNRLLLNRQFHNLQFKGHAFVKNVFWNVKDMTAYFKKW